MFLLVLLTILNVAVVCFPFSPQMQHLVTCFLAVGVCLFKLSLSSLLTPLSLKKKKDNGVANYDGNTALWVLALLMPRPVQQKKKFYFY